MLAAAPAVNRIGQKEGLDAPAVNIAQRCTEHGILYRECEEFASGVRQCVVMRDPG